MKNMDENGLKLCDMQAKIFAGTLSHTACSSAVFIRRFMFSSFAKRLDGGSFLYETASLSDAYEEIEREYGKTAYGKVKYAEEELYWIGYMYRYWCYLYQEKSKTVYQTIYPKKLRKLYYPYHSLSPESAIERILEAKGEEKEDITQKGVRILRQIRQKKQED